MDRKEKYIRVINSKSTEDKILLVTKLTIKERIENGIGLLLNISSIIEQLQYVFPDKWDIQFENSHEDNGRLILKVEFVIHFPHIVITNSKEMKHIIKDLYVKLESIESPLDGSYTFDEFKGKRMSASAEEVLSNYQHSHQFPGSYKEIEAFLQTKESWYGQSSAVSYDVFAYRRFCTGSSEINQILTMLSARYNANIFKMFLLQLDLYVRWESLEGVPHIKLENVIGRADSKQISWTQRRDFYDMLKLNEIDVDFKIEKNQIRIVDNEKFERFLKFDGEKIESYSFSFRNHLCIKDEKGDYFSIRTIPTSFPAELLAPKEQLDQISWYFKGELVEFKVKYQTEEEKVIITEKPFFVHKDIKEYAKRKLEDKIKAERLRSYFSGKFSQTDNTTRNIEQNKISLQ
jgi:hypothetical protein